MLATASRSTEVLVRGEWEMNVNGSKPHRWLQTILFLFLLSSCSSMTEKIVGKDCKEFYGWKDHWLCEKVEE